MKRLEILKYVRDSWWALILINGIPFGLIMFFVIGNRGTGSAIGAAVGGLVFGLLMSFSFKLRLRKNIDFAEKHSITKNKTFDEYIWNCTVPTSEEKKSELKTYMEKKVNKIHDANRIAYPKKYSRYSTYALLLVFFLLTLSIESLRLLALIYPLVIGTSLYGEYRNKMLLKRIEALRNKL